jgi:acyl-CoA synthetase (AMP-forming)/AMP-acid ligase II
VSMCLPGDDAETIATTAGRALPDTEVRCVDADGKEVPRGTPGEIHVRGYNVMRGYFEDPAETAKTIDAEGWLHTGDVGVMDERGYLRITDRIKDMFITGGFNCYPAEIENLMHRHPGVAQVAVIGVPDERMGEVGMAFVVPRPGAALDAAGLSAWCRNEMANFKVPRRIEIVDALPTNASGKVLKYELRRRSPC